MSFNFFPIFTIQSVMYMLILKEAKAQVISMKGTLGECQLLNLENIGKPPVSIHEVVWKKGTVLMGKMKGQNATVCERYRDRCYILKNGSLRLCPTLTRDDGQYTADVFTEHGEQLYNQTFQLELIESEKTTNYPHLLFFIFTGVCVVTFLLIFGSSTYYFGKWKNMAGNKHPTLQKRQATEMIEGQKYLFILQEETVAAGERHNVEYSVPIRISTFK
ncbi:uncharacterized protein LOC143839784 [Paroedura picta]|uniref:uncharacterized protein LOC143839784 n=1 Tax=Paroedura picta TaxID=143630 RepID=UPI0040570E44